jgi:hypothetical protein
MWGRCFKNSAKDKFYAVIIYGIKSYIYGIKVIKTKVGKKNSTFGGYSLQFSSFFI